MSIKKWLSKFFKALTFLIILALISFLLPTFFYLFVDIWTASGRAQLLPDIFFGFQVVVYITIVLGVPGIILSYIEKVHRKKSGKAYQAMKALYIISICIALSTIGFWYYTHIIKHVWFSETRSHLDWWVVPYISLPLFILYHFIHDKNYFEDKEAKKMEIDFLFGIN